ncbi:MAG TPA: dimethylsulfonioproprionate lyase family protein [Mesorhizobium sp.]|jgi:hypothetical protein|nr:dimethylsulfonioproprionate lyase family protein [Mesorhizobium sp.]
MTRPGELKGLLDAVQRFLGSFGAALPARFVTPLLDPPSSRPLAARRLPCLRFLPTVVDAAPGESESLVTRFVHLAPSLHWGQTYSAADLGADFLDRYGWVELVGTRGHFASESLAAGFLLLGPHTLYPDHHHEAEEIYIPLTSGAEWRKGEEPFRQRRADEVIHHAPNVPHAMRTGEAPLLALYLWRGGPLAQRSILNGVSS